MKKIAIIGAGELGLQIVNLINNCIGNYIIVGFFDDFSKENSLISDNYRILGKIKDIENEYSKKTFDETFIAIGYNHMSTREAIYNKFKNKIPFANLIHKTAIIDSTAKLGVGIAVYAGSIIDKEVEICDNVLLNIGTIISHNSIINKHSFIAPGVNCAGFVSIGEKCFIGINTTIIDNIKICSNVIIGGGSVIHKNILEQGVYVGNPFHEIK